MSDRWRVVILNDTSRHGKRVGVMRQDAAKETTNENDCILGESYMTEAEAEQGAADARRKYGIKG